MSLQRCSSILWQRGARQQICPLIWSIKHGLPRNQDPYRPPVRGASTTSAPVKRVINSRNTLARNTSLKDVPPLSFFEDALRGPLSGADVSASDCALAVHKYYKIALEDVPSWRQHLTSRHGLSIFTLHYAAAAILLRPGNRAAFLALHILDTNSRLGYRPSILTAVRFTMQHGGTAMVTAAWEAHDRMVRTGKPDPDALTLQGLRHVLGSNAGGESAALPWFKKAGRIGGEEPGSWEWQPINYTSMATIVWKKNNMEKAMPLMKYAAEQLESPTAMATYPQHAKDMDESEREIMLKRAALAGEKSAAGNLAKHYKDSLANMKPKSSKREMKVASVLAEEWAAVAS